MRYLNAVGGGKVTRVEGKIAYVDDQGFETPVQARELVVVLPAGHEPSLKGAKKMFDQEAFDAGKSDERRKPKQETPAPAKAPAPEEEDFPIVETDYGDAMTVVLGFEPANVKDLERTSISAVLVNDSNYFLDYVLLRRAEAGAGWKVVSRGEAAPNELVDLASYTQQTIKELERIVFQAVAYKSYKDFEVKSPLNVSRKLDLTKFFKLHCFRPGVYFDRPAIEVTLYKEQEPRRAAAPEKKRGR